MENYKQIFGDDNKIAIEQLDEKRRNLQTKIKNKTFPVEILSYVFWIACTLMALYLSMGWGFLGFQTEWLSRFIDNKVVLLFVSMLIALAACALLCIIIVMIINDLIQTFIKTSLEEKHQPIIRNLEEQLWKEATIFATTVYLPDVFKSLSTTFTLTNEFKENLKQFMILYGHNLQYGWFTHNEFDSKGPKPNYLNKQSTEIVIQHQECSYYLKGWEYHEAVPSFRFFFEKIYTDGRLEKVEYELPKK